MSFKYSQFYKGSRKQQVTPVSRPIRGREEDMRPSSGGQGYAFAVNADEQLRRWLILGSSSSTMYATAAELTIDNMQVVEELLYADHKLVLQTLEEVSVKNLAPKQGPMLAALAMALSYEDNTVRVYNHIDPEPVAVIEVPVSGRVQYVASNPYGGDLYIVAHNDDGRDPSYFVCDMDTMKIKPTTRDALGSLKQRDMLMTSDYQITVHSRQVRRGALSVAQKMIRQSSQLFEVIDNLNALRGWGKTTHKVIQMFYDNLDDRDLAYQLVKYGQRKGWAHSDLFRKTKPKQGSSVRSNLIGWSVDKYSALESVYPDPTRNERGFVADPMSLIWAAERVKFASNEGEVISLIRDYDLPREAIERADTQWLNSPDVWAALLEKMPMNAMVRNLRKMAQVGLLTPMSDAERFIAQQLRNEQKIRNARVHPFRLVQAALMYDSNFTGAGSGGLRWVNRNVDHNTSKVVVDALNDALEMSFSNVSPSNKSIVVAVDVSGSMWMNMIPSANPLTPAEAAAVFAMIIAKTEPNYEILAFSNRLSSLEISKRSDIQSAVRAVRETRMGSTNLGLPIIEASQKQWNVDGFVTITDNEVNTGHHPSQLIKRYRKEHVVTARYVAVAMTATNISVADPEDHGMLDVVGFNADAVDLISRFVGHDF